MFSQAHALLFCAAHSCNWRTVTAVVPLLRCAEMGLAVDLGPFLELYQAGSRRHILPAGQKSDAKDVQAVCMISVAKMVQAARAAQIQTHLVQLVPALLESLSSMEVREPCRQAFTENSTTYRLPVCHSSITTE